jgi:hypothetical protein
MVMPEFMCQNADLHLLLASNKMTCANACLQAVLMEPPKKHCLQAGHRPKVGRGAHINL